MNQYKDITYQYKFDELRMDLKHPNNKDTSFILVEGPTDERLYRKLFDLNYCKVEWVPGGNSKLEKCVIDLLPLHSFIIGIRDADFLYFSNSSYTKKNIFLTDLHDIEMSMIAENDIFSAIIHEYLPNYQKKEHLNIKSDIFKIVENLSLWKWINENESLEIPFKEIEFQNLISIENLSIDFEQYLIQLNRTLKKNGHSTTDFPLEQIEKLKSNNLDYFQLTNGHDFLKALAEFLRKKSKNNDLKAATLESVFRINFSYSHFKNTILYKETQKWEIANACRIHFK